MAVERADPAPPSGEALRARYGLTPTQGWVALLLAEGQGYPAVGAVLGVSVHTARHHAEAVRRKLGAHTAAEVAAAVLGRGPALRDG